MARGYGDQVRSILREHNCHFVRQGKGDHEIWESPINGRRFTVDRTILSRHTANAVFKQAGINKKL
jgi:HicA toxin of bacterial toxin-antitoxin,